MKIIIMRGIQGSGKSTWIARNYPEAFVCSADKYFEDKKYDYSKLDEAHGQCMRAFIHAVEQGLSSTPDDVICVDNTNATAIEIAPYIAVASAFGVRDVSIVTIVCDPNIAALRNVHSVPRDVVQRKHEQFLNVRLSPHWKNTYENN